MAKAARPKRASRAKQGHAKRKTVQTGTVEPPIGLASISRLAKAAVGSVLSFVTPRSKSRKRAAQKTDTAEKLAAEKAPPPVMTSSKRPRKPARTRGSSLPPLLR